MAEVKPVERLGGAHDQIRDASSSAAVGQVGAVVVGRAVVDLQVGPEGGDTWDVPRAMNYTAAERARFTDSFFR